MKWCIPGFLGAMIEAWRSAPFKGCGLLVWTLEDQSLCSYLASLEGKKWKDFQW